MSKGRLHEQYEMEELLPIVAELTEKYTSGESTSITYEKAEQLMEAVMYCIDECESGPSEGSLIAEEKVMSAREAYELGYGLVISKAKRLREQFNALIPTFDAYGNRAYQETVVKGIPGFFLYYDPKFKPQDHILTLDYPVLSPRFTSCGVDVMEDYIRAVAAEQHFLCKLPREYIIKVLENYHSDYEELLINISAVVMRNLIGAMLADKKLSQKGFTREDYKVIKEQIGEKTQEELKEQLLKLLRLFLKQTYKEEADELIAYFSKDLSDFSYELKNAVEHDALTAFFVY